MIFFVCVFASFYIYIYFKLQSLQAAADSFAEFSELRTIAVVLKLLLSVLGGYLEPPFPPPFTVFSRY